MEIIEVAASVKRLQLLSLQDLVVREYLKGKDDIVLSLKNPLEKFVLFMKDKKLIT